MHFMRLSLFLALPTLLAAQASTEPVFRSESNLVEVSVSARDHSDQPVLGLKQNDFELFEGKERQQIRVFVPPYDGNPAKEAARPGTFTNHASAVTSRAGLTVFLLDWLNTDYNSVLRSRRSATIALELLPRHEMKGVYLLTDGRVSLLHGLTTDGPSLLRALRSSPFPSPVPSGTMLLKMQGLFEAFDIISKQLTSIPGRKTLIWISNGFPMFGGVRLDIDKAAHSLNEANITLYAVDSRGLIPGGPFGQANPWVNAEVMQRIALRTGGLLYFNRNDIDKAMTQATQDAYASYILGYYRPPGDEPAPSRRISVRVVKRGISVTAGERQSRMPSAGTHQESTADSPQIDLNADASKREDTLSLRLRIGMSSFVLRENNLVWQGEGRIQFHFVTADGQEAGAAEFKQITASLSPDNRAKITRDGLTYSTSLRTPPEAAALEVAVRDDASGRTGKLVIDLALVPSQTVIAP